MFTLGDKTNRYLVEFTDGSKKRVTPSRIRILSQYGSTETSEENAEIVTTRQEELVLDVQGQFQASIIHISSPMEVGGWGDFKHPTFQQNTPFFSIS